jgi:hypothetical protein
VDVHVPQARTQKLAGGVDDAGAGRRLDIFRDACDSAVCDSDRDIYVRFGAGCVYDGGVLENDALREQRDRRKSPES